MKFTIKNRWNGSEIYSGEGADLREVIINAVKSSANLSGANLSGARLNVKNYTAKMDYIIKNVAYFDAIRTVSFK